MWGIVGEGVLQRWGRRKVADFVPAKFEIWASVKGTKTGAGFFVLYYSLFKLL